MCRFAWTLMGILALSVCQAKAEPELVLQGGITLTVDGERFPYGSKTILCRDASRTYCMIDARTGTILRRYPELMNTLVVSPDGQTMTAQSKDGNQVLVDIATGRTLRTFDKERPYKAIFSPDGNHLVFYTYGNKTVSAWSVETGKLLWSLEPKKVSGISQVVDWQDGRTLVLTLSGSAGFLDVETGEIVDDPPARKGKELHCISATVSPDCRFLAASFECDDQIYDEALLWNLQTGSEPVDVDRPDSLPVYGMTFSPDSLTLATYTCTPRFWDVQTGQLRHEMKIRAESIEYHPDGRTFIINSDQNQKRSVWDSETFEKLRSYEAGPSKFVHLLAFSPDGQTLITGLGENEAESDRRQYTTMIWDLQTGRKHRKFGVDGRAISCASFNPEDSSVVTAFAGRDICLWDSQIRRIEKRFLLPASALEIARLKDGRLAAICANRVPVIWDVRTGKKISTCAGIEKFGRHAFSPDGSAVALTSSYPYRTSLWDVETGKKIVELKDLRSDINHLAFSPDGKMITALGCCVWDTKTGERIHLYQDRTLYNRYSFFSSRSQASVFSSDGRMLLAGLSDGRVVLREVESGNALHLFDGHAQPVSHVVFHPNGRMIASGSSDGTIKFWSIETGEQLLTLVHFDQGREWLAYTPAGLYDGTTGGMERVTFRIDEGLRVVSRHRFIEDYHRPGLIAEIMRGERPLPGDSLAENVE